MGILTPKKKTTDEIVQEVLKENKGLQDVYNKDNVQVVMATPERAAATDGYGRSIEYWPPNEPGSPDLPRPEGTRGKHVLEIYAPELQKDEKKLKDAIYGDLLHGMSQSPYFNALRQEFKENYNPSTAAFNSQWLKKQGHDANSEAMHDMFIRGKLAANQGAEWNEPGRYSPRQLEILKKMKNFLTTGDKR